MAPRSHSRGCSSSASNSSSMSSSAPLRLLFLVVALCGSCMFASASDACTGSVCSGVADAKTWGDVTYCCLDGTMTLWQTSYNSGVYSATALCSESQSCVAPVVDPQSDVAVREGVQNQGSITLGSDSTGTVLNANEGIITLASPTCADTTLPERYTRSSGCDTTHDYNHCVRGSVQVNAQQWSRYWCQSDSGVSCPSGLRPMLTMGKFVSDINIIGQTTNGDSFPVNRFRAPAGRCYAPATDGEQLTIKQVGSAQTDLCVRVKCDGSAGTLGFGVKNCNNIQHSLLFTCYDPCNDCDKAGTLSCAASGLSETCTCRPGFTGRYCEDGSAAPVDGGWSAWSVCNTYLCLKTRLCDSPPPLNGGRCQGNQFEPCDVVPPECIKASSSSSSSTGAAAPSEPAGVTDSSSTAASTTNTMSPAAAQASATAITTVAASAMVACALLAL